MEYSSQAREIDVLLARYAESHRDPINEAIHCVCIPAIIFSLMGLLWAIHPACTVGLVIGTLGYYSKLSRQFAFGMVAMASVFTLLLSALPEGTVLVTSIAVFVLAWLGQFIGHAIEGKKPSFFDDLRFLLIGPLFVLAILYRRIHVAY